MLYAQQEIFPDQKSSWSAKKHPKNLEILELDLLGENLENTLENIFRDFGTQRSSASN